LLHIICENVAIADEEYFQGIPGLRGDQGEVKEDQCEKKLEKEPIRFFHWLHSFAAAAAVSCGLLFVSLETKPKGFRFPPRRRL
jgi:hypothetical protein